MFDSRQYEYNDLTVVMGGKMITGLRGIKYKPKQEKEPLYGKGNKPQSIQRGNKSYEGEISLLQSEMESLRASTPTGDILDLQMDIVVCYGNPSNGDVMITDIVKGAEFTEGEKGMKQGDKHMEVTLPFIALDVLHQIR